MSGSRDSVLVYVLLLAAVLPVLAAWWLVDTLDWTPWLVLIAVGAALAVAGRKTLSLVRARLRRASAAAVAGEVAPEHAPGGWFVWVALPLWCASLGLFANAYLDGSPPERHPSQVLRRTSPSKGPGHVVLRDFRPGGEELQVHANSPLVRGLSPGQAVTLVVRRGLFGWPRIESIEQRP